MLAITSGYWDLASEFKPLLHTWSLGVEEQYYTIFPLFLMLGWRFFKKDLVRVIIGISFLSLALASWAVLSNPDSAFYLLHTRAWEILLGSLVGFYLNKEVNNIQSSIFKKQILSLLGLVLIVTSILLYSHNQSSPGLFMLIPTLGAALIIMYAQTGTAVGVLLGSRPMVGLGLISYSSYLWHQPLFAFSRIYLVDPPSTSISVTLIVSTFILAYLTWKFIEIPFRSEVTISRKIILLLVIIISLFLISFGIYLNKSYGAPSRIYGDSVIREDIDKRIYNERVFNFKKDYFLHDKKLKILVSGNSFGRDFVNMTIETFDLKKIEIIYRDDLMDCIIPFKNNISQKLFSAADIIIFASGFQNNCIGNDIEFSNKNGKKIFYIGTKHFGYNLNWIIRLRYDNIANQYNPLLQETLNLEREMSSAVPQQNYISLLSPIIKGGTIPITDEIGRPLSTDRFHLTKYGAKFIGEKALLESQYGELITWTNSVGDVKVLNTHK